MSGKPTCVNCKYYEKSPYHKDQGECRKNPPVVIAVTASAVTNFCPDQFYKFE